LLNTRCVPGTFTALGGDAVEIIKMK
jgi:hypothetical protein